MATVLGFTGAVCAIFMACAGYLGWRAHFWHEAYKVTEREHSRCADGWLVSEAQLARKSAEKEEVLEQYNILVKKLEEKARTPSPVEPKKGSWAEIRKSNERANLREAEISAAHERDTAFQEN